MTQMFENLLPVAPNPCIRVYGAGPEGTTCRACVHIVQRRYSRNYYKCDLRRQSACEATDHRLKWQSCGRYEARP